MTFQIIDGETFVNGIPMEVDTIPQEQIEESLATLTIQINNKKNTLDKLLQQRDEVIVHAFNNGFSAIQLGKLLNLTRQRIYEVVKGKQPNKNLLLNKETRLNTTSYCTNSGGNERSRRKIFRITGTKIKR